MMRAVLLSVTIALFLLLAGFFSVYYDGGSHGMYARYAGEREVEVDGIRHFLDSNEDVAALDFLDESERAHMVDVRHVLNGCKAAFVILILLLLSQLLRLFLGANEGVPKRTTTGTEKKNDVIRTSCFLGGAGALAIVALLAFLSLFDFSAFWTAFHHVLFPQGNWQFPAESALIRLFPQAFFEKFAIDVLLATASYGVVAIALGWALKNPSRLS
jgi:uncharacterized membrane protein